MLLKPFHKCVQLSNHLPTPPKSSSPSFNWSINSISGQFENTFNSHCEAYNLSQIINFTGKKDNKIATIADHDIPFGVTSLPSNNLIMFSNFINRKSASKLIKVGHVIMKKKFFFSFNYYLFVIINFSSRKKSISISCPFLFIFLLTHFDLSNQTHNQLLDDLIIIFLLPFICCNILFGSDKHSP